MRRLLVITLLLLSAISVSAQQEPPVPRFEIDSVQVIPDGTMAIFRIGPSASYWQGIWATPPGELYKINLLTGRVVPLALQPKGLVYCLTLPNEERRECQDIYYGVPAYIPDWGHFAWIEVYDDITDPDWFFHTQIGLNMMEAAPGYNGYLPDTVMLGWIDVALLVPALRQAGSLGFYSIVDGPTREGTFKDYMRIYNFRQRHYTTIETAEWDGSNADTQPLHFWVWPEYEGQTLPVGASHDGQWHVFDIDQETITKTAFSPVAEVKGELLQYIYTPIEAGRSWWQVAVADPALSPEEAIQRARELTNADAAESVRAALEAALIAEFSQTGFSLHPGMTAIFDEFQIYDVLGVEREDTLLVPLEWRLAQPPEGESRPLDVEGPIPFPTQEDINRG